MFYQHKHMQDDNRQESLRLFRKKEGQAYFFFDVLRRLHLRPKAPPIIPVILGTTPKATIFEAEAITPAVVIPAINPTPLPTKIPVPTSIIPFRLGLRLAWFERLIKFVILIQRRFIFNGFI
jgi:hypothetical protein